MNIKDTLYKIRNAIGEGRYDGAFQALYPGCGAEGCRARYTGLIGMFVDAYIINETGEGSETGVGESGGRVALVSAPGRAEVCGNHTDHQHGNVLAAAVDQDIICVAVTNNDNCIRVRSVGHEGAVCVDLAGLNPLEDEKGTDTALIRGIAAWFKERGAGICGFDAYTSSNVPIGSGLSSSAAFEVVIGAAVNTLFGAGFSPLEIAIAGQFAENNYFGKPCGLMDQTASSVGGFVRIDFNDPKNPIVEPIQFDLASHGLKLCVVNTKGSHANLIGEYASIPGEMRAVASFFGKGYLRDVNEDEFFKNIGAVRGRLAERDGAPSNDGNIAADRALLRAIHFFNENKLVSKTAESLRAADTELFLDCINRSGQSSFCYLQNIYAPSRPEEQGLSLALALSESLLRGKGGAWRVHGGGFAGTIMAFVPDGIYESYITALGAVFGEDACITLSIRRFGGVEVTPVLA